MMVDKEELKKLRDSRYASKRKKKSRKEYAKEKDDYGPYWRDESNK